MPASLMLPSPVALRERIYARLSELGITPSEFLARAHGRKPDGKPRASGPFYAAMKGTSAVTQGRLNQWAKALEIPVEELLALTPDDNFTRVGRPSSSPKPRKPPMPRPKSAAQFIAQLEPPGPTLTQLAPKPSTSHLPQFSLVVDQAGLAILRLNLVDVPIDQAMKVVTTLTTLGLIGKGG